MSAPDKRFSPPRVDTTGLQERKILEAQGLSNDFQLRGFEQNIRPRLAARDQKADVLLQSLSAHRAEIATALKKLSVPSGISIEKIKVPPPRLDLPLVELPLSPARFLPGVGIFGLGSSGFVQMGPATDHVDVVPACPYPLSGEIMTSGLSDDGRISFDGDLSIGPDSIAPEKYSPEIRYFWLRNWIYLVPFPAPSVTSTFTYRFDLNVFLSLFCEGGLGTFMSFVSVGETANLQPGQDIVVNQDAGWPLVADLSVPNATTGAYNGRYGYLQGSVTVQRSFRVAAGQVPAVAIVVGAVAGLPMMERLRLDFPGLGPSGITPLQQGNVGRIAYHHAPDWVLASS